MSCEDIVIGSSVSRLLSSNWSKTTLKEVKRMKGATT